MEIGRESINDTSNKNFEQIKKGFFYDLKSYDEIIVSRKEKERLKNEIKNLELQLITEKERYNAYSKVVQSLERLFNARIYENDIIKMENIILMTDTHLYKNKPSKYKQNLMDDLQKYGNLNLDIKNLQDKKKKKINLKFEKKTQPQGHLQKPKKESETVMTLTV